MIKNDSFISNKPSKVVMGIQKLKNYRTKVINKLSTSNKVKTMEESPNNNNKETNMLQFNRMGVHFQTMKTLQNAAEQVKNIISDLLVQAPADEKKLYNIEKELKEIKENNIPFTLQTLSISEKDSSDSDFYWRNSQTVLGGPKKAKTKKPRNMSHTSLNDFGYNWKKAKTSSKTMIRKITKNSTIKNNKTARRSLSNIVVSMKDKGSSIRKMKMNMNNDKGSEYRSERKSLKDDNIRNSMIKLNCESKRHRSFSFERRSSKIKEKNMQLNEKETIEKGYNSCIMFSPHLITKNKKPRLNKFRTQYDQNCKKTENKDNKYLSYSKKEKLLKWKTNIEDKNDYNDIRNIMDLDSKKYKQFNKICNGIRKSITILPQEIEKDQKEENISSKESESEIGSQSSEDSISENSKNVISPINSQTSSKKSSHDQNASPSIKLPEEDEYETQSQKIVKDKARIKELKFRCLIKQNQLVYDSLSDEEVDEDIIDDIYLRPNSNFKFIWDMFFFFFSCYSIITTPYEMAFNIYEFPSLLSFSSFVDYIIDICFLGDLCLGFIMPFYNFEELLITKFPLIAMHYLKGWFFCDFIAGIPFRSIILFYNSFTYKKVILSYSSESSKLIDLLSLCRLFKLFKVAIENEFSSFLYSLITRNELVQRVFNVTLMIFLFIISTHVLSCIFIFLGQLDYPNWILEQGFEIVQKLDIYIASFYYIFATIFTVGYGDMLSVSIYERFFNLILLVVGIMIYSYFVTALSNYVQAVDSKTLDYQKRMAILEQIRVTHEKMESSLYEKIARFLKYKLVEEKRDKMDIIGYLPISLRNKLIMEMYRDVIQNFFFFKSFDNTDFIIRVILAFKSIKVNKNEMLVNEGEYIEEIIFVKRGRLSIEKALPVVIVEEPMNTQKQVATKSIRDFASLRFAKTSNCFNQVEPTLTKTRKSISIIPKKETPPPQSIKIIEIRKNEHFGDVVMFLEKKSPLSVKVKSKTAEIFLLKKTDAVEISMSFPKIWRKILKKSVFNMQQIERLINKSLQFFIQKNHKAMIKRNKDSIIQKGTLFSKGTGIINELQFNEEMTELQRIPTSSDEWERSEEESGESLDENEEDEDEDEDENENEGNEMKERIKEEEDSGYEEQGKGKFSLGIKTICEESSEFEYGNDMNSAKNMTKNSKTIKTQTQSQDEKDLISSGSSEQNTIKVEIENEKVNYQDTEDELIYPNNEKSISHSELITESVNSLPYSFEDINKENFPFEPFIDVKDSSTIRTIMPCYNSIHTSEKGPIIFKEGNNDKESSLISLQTNKELLDQSEEKIIIDEGNINIITSFSELNIVHVYSFNFIMNNNGCQTQVGNEMNQMSNNNNCLSVIKFPITEGSNQNQTEFENYAIIKELGSSRRKKEEKNEMCKSRKDGMEENYENNSNKNPSSRQFNMKDFKKIRKSIIGSDLMLANIISNISYRSKGNEDNSPKKKKKESRNAMEVISQNIENNQNNLNNSQDFYANFFSNVLLKEQKDNQQMDLVEKKDI